VLRMEPRTLIGRPPIAKETQRFSITLTKRDYDILCEFTKLAHLPAASFVRSIVEQSIPDLKALVDAHKLARDNGKKLVRIKAIAAVSPGGVIQDD